MEKQTPGRGDLSVNGEEAGLDGIRSSYRTRISHPSIHPIKDILPVQHQVRSGTEYPGLPSVLRFARNFAGVESTGINLCHTRGVSL